MKPTKKGLEPAPLMDNTFKSNVPYGSELPLDSCPDPIKCVDTIDTDCVIYTGQDLSCQGTTVINTDDNLSTALESMVDFICTYAGVGLQGAQGVQGVQGVQGKDGLSIQGATGQTGSGIQGAQGSQGVQGAQGLRGAKGDTGLQGTQGPQGTAGLNGSQGAQGSQGVQGTTGFGLQGSQGAQGRTGIQGPPGTNGTNGANGINGSQGAQGPAGEGSSYAKQHAFESGLSVSYDYNGSAPPGTLQSVTGWTIYRVAVVPSGSSSIQSATVNPGGCIWDNYNTYSYI